MIHVDSNNMNKTKLVYILLIASALSIIFFHKSIIEKINTALYHNSSEKIAHLNKATGVVKLKPNKSLRFARISEGTDLNNRDTLYTERTSSALVTFITEDEILIAPNSEVVIEIPKEAEAKKNIVVTFLRGNFKLTKKSKSSSNIIFNKGSYRREISSIPVAKNAVENEIPKNFNEYQEEQKATARVKLSSPVFTTKEYKFEITSDVRNEKLGDFLVTSTPLIQWNHEADTFYQIQFSTNKDFSKLDLETTSSTKNTIAALPPGLYYSRVRAYDEMNSPSDWSHATKIQVINSPPSNLKSEFVAQDQAYLSWKSNGEYSKYEIEIKTPSKKINYISNKKNHIFFTSKNGIYTWKVREVNSSNWPISRWSRSNSFEYSKLRDIAIAEAVEPSIEPTKFESKEIINLQEEAPKKKTKNNFFAKAGMGLKYFLYTQKNTSLLENGNFSSLSSTSGTAELGYHLNEKNTISLTYNLAPIKIKANDNLISDKDSFNIQIINLLGTYLYRSSDVFKYYIEYGASQETTPFFIPGTLTDVSIIENDITYVNLGLKTFYTGQEKIDYLLSLSYRHPIGGTLEGSSKFEITPSYSFLLTAGADYRISEKSQLELKYSLQKTSFEYDFSASITGDSSGNRDMTDHSLILGYKYFLFANFINSIRRRRKK